MASEGRLNIVASARMQELIAEQTRVKQSVRELAREYGVSQSVVRKAARELDRQERSAKKAAVGNRRLSRSLRGVGGQAAQAAAGLTSFGGQAASLAASGGPVGLAAAAVAGLGGAAVAAAMKMSTLVDKIGLLAEGTGLSVRSTLAIRRAMSEAGASFDRARTGLAAFTKRMSDAINKGGEAAAGFDRYGIAVRGAGGEMRSADAVLQDVLSTLDNIESPTERAALRMELFGAEAGAAMASLSSASMNQALSSTSELADNVDRAQGASKEMNAATARLSTSWENFVLILGTKTAGPVADTIDALSSMVDVLDEAHDAYTTFTTALSYIDTTQYGIWLLGEAWSAVAGEAEQAAIQSERAAGAWADLPVAATGMTAPEVQPGRRARTQGPQRSAGPDRTATSIAKAEQEALREIYTETERQRAEQIERGRQLAQDAAQSAIDAERQAAERRAQMHAAEMQRLQARREMHEAIGLAGVDAAVSIAGAVGGSSDIVIAAQIAQALAYQAAAMARAMAEGGIIAGIPTALGMAGVLAGAIQQARGAQSQYDMGGQVAAGATQPDQGMARVRDGEMILTPLEADRMQRGRQDTAIIQIDHQTYQAARRSSGRQSALYPRRRGMVTA